MYIYKYKKKKKLEHFKGKNQNWKDVGCISVSCFTKKLNFIM